MGGVEIPNWALSALLVILLLVSLFFFVTSCGAWCASKWRRGSSHVAVDEQRQKIKSY